jgi:hypothetical protein
MRVYIAGALSSKENINRNPTEVVCDYIRNLSTLCQKASELRKRGYYPYVPGLDFLLGVINGNWTEEDYRDLGIAFLEVCDAILVTSDSWGVQKEIERAKELGIPVYYSLEEIGC